MCTSSGWMCPIYTIICSFSNKAHRGVGDQYYTRCVTRSLRSGPSAFFSVLRQASTHAIIPRGFLEALLTSALFPKALTPPEPPSILPFPSLSRRTVFNVDGNPASEPWPCSLYSQPLSHLLVLRGRRHVVRIYIKRTI